VNRGALLAALLVLVGGVVSYTLHQLKKDSPNGNRLTLSSQANPDGGGEGGPKDGGPPEIIEVLPAEEEILDAAGTPDSKNRYLSTVVVSLHKPKEGAECSGVIIGPRNVLTAAHCVCKPPKSPSGRGVPTAMVDHTQCSEQAYASTVRFSSTHSADSVELRTYHGSVHPHPEFKMLVDGDGYIVSVTADLAVVMLQKALEEKLPELRLGEDEIQSHEVLVMAGYGHGEEWGGGYDRYYRSNKIIGPENSSKDRFIYQQQGAFIYNGFDGGPCFREQGAQRWLAGIASVGSEKALTLTSIFAHRAWIQSELQRVPQ